MGGVLVAVLLGAAIAGGPRIAARLGPVLVTVLVGGVVFALVGRRARERERLQAVDTPTPSDAADVAVTDPQESDRE